MVSTLSTYYPHARYSKACEEMLADRPEWSTLANGVWLNTPPVITERTVLVYYDGVQMASYEFCTPVGSELVIGVYSHADLEDYVARWLFAPTTEKEVSEVLDAWNTPASGQETPLANLRTFEAFADKTWYYVVDYVGSDIVAAWRIYECGESLRPRK